MATSLVMCGRRCCHGNLNVVFFRLFKLCDISTLNGVLVFYTYHCHGNIKHYLRLRNTTSSKFLLLDPFFHEQEEGIIVHV